jgi:hypothetical protein
MEPTWRTLSRGRWDAKQARMTATDTSPSSGLAQFAAATTAFVGGWAVFFAGAHLISVIAAATMGYYPAYQFRFAALLIVGMTLVYGGLVCITAVRGLASGRRSAWGRAVIGTSLIVLVSVPLIPLQPDVASPIALLSMLNLVALLGAWRGVRGG